MPHYKFHYFNGRGRGEISRLILTAAGEKFEDIRYEIEDWPKYKSQMPLGQVPVLDVDGVQIPQSMAIARYLAREHNMAGSNSLDQAKVEAVADSASDLLNKLGPIIWYQEEPQKSESLKTFFADELPKHLVNLETLAKSYSDGDTFFVGKQLTLADLYVYDVLENIVKIDKNILSKYAWLDANRKEIEKNSRIAAYLKDRPDTAF